MVAQNHTFLFFTGRVIFPLSMKENSGANLESGLFLINSMAYWALLAAYDAGSISMTFLK